MQNITQTIVQLNITHRSVQLHGYTPSRFSVGGRVSEWLQNYTPTIPPVSPPHLLCVSFIVCGHWIILRGISHQTQTAIPRSAHWLVAFYIWYKSLPRQCQLLCRMDTSIFRRRIGKNIEIYCSCIAQNYREPIQYQCIPSNNTLNYV